MILIVHEMLHCVYMEYSVGSFQPSDNSVYVLYCVLKCVSIPDKMLRIMAV